jgi:hypothetical protein
VGDGDYFVAVLHSDVVAMTEVTREGRELIQRWVNADAGVSQAQRELKRAEEHLNETANALAEWLLPADAMCGETIAIWHGSSLIAVTKMDGDLNPHRIKIRTRGRPEDFQPEYGNLRNDRGAKG